MVSTVLLNPVAIVGSRIEITGFNEYKGNLWNNYQGVVDGMLKLY